MAGPALPEKEARGDCFEVAANLVLELDGDWRLVHATCMGYGPIEGIRFSHAWVENDFLVLDFSNGKQSAIPRTAYYEAGEAENVHRYTATEARLHMLATEHYGPWAEVVMTGGA